MSLQATGDILDGNDVRLPLTLNTNVRATNLRMVAGGTIGRPDAITLNPEVNLEAIDLEVGTVAAQRPLVFYLQELAVGGALTIGNVAPTSVTVNVQDVEFRSTTSLVTETRSQGTLMT